MKERKNEIKIKEFVFYLFQNKGNEKWDENSFSQDMYFN